MFVLGMPLQAAAQGPYAALQCAAFWAGWVTVARTSAYLPQDPADAALAQGFAKAARSESPAETERHLARDTRDMARMIRAAIRGDATSIGLMERLARGCEDAARKRGLI